MWGRIVCPHLLGWWASHSGRATPPQPLVISIFSVCDTIVVSRYKHSVHMKKQCVRKKPQVSCIAVSSKQDLKGRYLPDGGEGAARAGEGGGSQGGGLGGCGGKGWGGHGSNSEKAMKQSRSKSGQFMKGRLAQDAGIVKAGKKQPAHEGVVLTCPLSNGGGSKVGHGNAAGKKPLQGKPVHYQDPGERAVCKIDSCNRFVWEVPGNQSEFCSGKHALDWLQSGGVFKWD